MNSKGEWREGVWISHDPRVIWDKNFKEILLIFQELVCNLLLCTGDNCANRFVFVFME